MKITDGKKTAEIKMMVWLGHDFSPDWSPDFFDAGRLEYDGETDTYKVDNVDYCIDQVRDWEACQGDFADYEPDENNVVIITEI